MFAISAEKAKLGLAGWLAGRLAVRVVAHGFDPVVLLLADCCGALAVPLF